MCSTLLGTIVVLVLLLEHCSIILMIIFFDSLYCFM